MRGRRRGRNRSSSQDPPDQGSESGSTTAGTGSVTLIRTPPSPSSSESEEIPGADDPQAGTSPDLGKSPDPPPLRNIEETISDVVTARAELDSVLTPSQPKPIDLDETFEEPDRVGDTPVAPEAAPVDVRQSVTVAPPPAVEPDPEIPSEPAAASAMEPESSVTQMVPGSPKRPPAEIVVPPPTEESAVRSEDALAVDAHETPGVEAQAASGNPLPRVLAVANQKGGVGKTTTSVNLGAALAELGFRVLVIDLDPQGNATTGLGIDARNFELSMYDVLMRDSSLEDCVEPTSMKNLFVAPATIALAGAEIELVPAFSRELKLKKSIESIIDDFDYVLIDCPPSLGLITVNALAAADEVLVPIQCEYYALEGLSQLMRNVHLVASNLNPKLDISTIVLTMYDARTKLSDQVANEVRLHFGTKVCRSVIPRTVRLSEAPSFGQPITAFDPASRGAIAYRELAKEVSGGKT